MLEGKGTSEESYETIVKRLNDDQEYAAKFWKSPSTFFEEVLGMKMSAARKSEIDAIYGEVAGKAKNKPFRLPNQPRDPKLPNQPRDPNEPSEDPHGPRPDI